MKQQWSKAKKKMRELTHPQEFLRLQRVLTWYVQFWFSARCANFAGSLSPARGGCGCRQGIDLASRERPSSVLAACPSSLSGASEYLSSLLSGWAKGQVPSPRGLFQLQILQESEKALFAGQLLPVVCPLSARCHVVSNNKVATRDRRGVLKNGSAAFLRIISLLRYTYEV